MSSSRTESRWLEVAGWALGAVLGGWAALTDETSFPISWTVAGLGDETGSWLGTMVFVDADAPLTWSEASAWLPLAEVFGGALPRAVLMAVFGAIWVAGMIRWSRLGGGESGREIAGGLAGAAVVALSHGNPAILGAAGLPWVVVGSLDGRSRWSGAAGWILLLLFSHSGLVVATGATIGLALLDPRLGSRPLVFGSFGWAALALLPLGEWTRVQHAEVAHVFLASSPWELSRMVSGMDGWGVAILGFVALAGWNRWPRQGTIAIAIGGASALVALGWDGGGGSVAVRWIYPSAIFFPLELLCSVSALAMLVLVGARPRGILRRAIVAVAIVVLVVDRDSGIVDETPAPSALREAPAGSRVLALPPRVAGPSWHEAAPDGVVLLNGRQEILSRNAALFYPDLELEGEPGAFRVARRLGATHLLVGGAADPSAPPSWTLVELEAAAPEATRSCRDLSRAAARSSESNEVAVPGRAIDGDRRTRWGTGGPQRPGQWFELDFAEAVVVDRIDLDVAQWATDVPAGFRALGRAKAGDDWREILVRDPYLGEPQWDEATGIGYLGLGEEESVVIHPGGIRLEAFRVELVREGGRWDWSIAEICVREAAAR